MGDLHFISRAQTLSLQEDPYAVVFQGDILAEFAYFVVCFSSTTADVTNHRSGSHPSIGRLRTSPLFSASSSSLLSLLPVRQRRASIFVATMASLKRKAGADIAATTADSKKPKQQQQSSLMSFFRGPNGGGGTNGTANGKNGMAKPATIIAPPPGAPAAASFKFNKASWVAKLTDEQRQLLRLEIDTMGESWLAVLKDELTTPSFLDLKRFLAREHNAGRTIFPPPQDVYSWSRHTSFNDVKVVILGQDPYHNHGQAHGLAFSVRPPVPPPPSLKNMYIALANDYPDGAFRPPPPHQGGLLTAWAERGVLLLNTCLTVRAHEANSHANHGWERFTQRVLDLVAQRRTRGVAFLAWGAPAAKRVAKIDATRHLVLRSVHPSPLSAHRGFFECGHFRAANDWLVQRYGPDGEIDWSLLPGTSTLGQRAKVEDKVVVEKKEVAAVKVSEEATETVTEATNDALTVGLERTKGDGKVEQEEGKEKEKKITENKNEGDSDKTEVKETALATDTGNGAQSSKTMAETETKVMTTSVQAKTTTTVVAAAAGEKELTVNYEEEKENVVITEADTTK
ncbi:uracil-DNA glycosylase [Niveomyces insectorum RCEF 264]|uniref:Uracil-DNA glycosylase n=1 Tax=Niveomyces insectorum RCEF 264 TaxID=1081102 RepID=A0A167MGY9_9HYPO|nr:uracil-DNA glycosylase [Niveomyces insectorum RCEF 264]